MREYNDNGHTVLIMDPLEAYQACNPQVLQAEWEKRMSETPATPEQEKEYWREATVHARYEAAKWQRKHDDVRSRYQMLWAASIIVVGALLMVAMGAC